VLENVVVSADDLLGGTKGLNNGWKQLLSTLDVEHIHMAAEGVGLAQGAYDETAKYIQERTQFNQAISKFQVIQHAMAEMYTEIEASRLLTYRAAGLADKHVPCYKESAMAKLYATETAKKVALKGLQFHGGYGYTMEYDIQRYVRDSLVMTIGGGTSEIQKNVIAGSLGF
jgi:butyryl-CoA dehydrogenase